MKPLVYLGSGLAFVGSKWRPCSASFSLTLFWMRCQTGPQSPSLLDDWSKPGTDVPDESTDLSLAVGHRKTDVLTSFTPFCRSRSTGGWLEADWWARKKNATNSEWLGRAGWLTETSLLELMDSVHGGRLHGKKIPRWKGRMWTDGTKEELFLLSTGYIWPLDHEEGAPYTGPESPSRLGTTKMIINGWGHSLLRSCPHWALFS